MLTGIALRKGMANGCKQKKIATNICRLLIKDFYWYLNWTVAPVSTRVPITQTTISKLSRIWELAGLIRAEYSSKLFYK